MSDRRPSERPAVLGHVMSAERISRDRPFLPLLMRCKLCWRVTVIVFTTIVIVEAIILLPSYVNFERDRLAGYRDAALAALSVATEAGKRQGAATPDVDRVSRHLRGRGGVKDFALLRADCTAVAPPDVRAENFRVAPGDCTPPRTQQINRQLLLVFSPWPDAATPVAALVIETPTLSNDLWAFVLRIAGLVAIIAFSVTVATMLVLRYSVLGRIVQLNAAMAAASHDPTNLHRYRIGADRHGDELSAVRKQYDALLGRLEHAVAELAKRESELRESAATLEKKVRERTAELAEARDTALAMSNAKSDFLAHMSHELRTPLNAIIGFSEAIRNRVLGPAAQSRYEEYNDDILSSARHLLELVQDILDTTLIESGKFRLQEESVDLDAVTRDIAAMMSREAERAGVQLRRADADWPRLRGDARRLRQAVLNLVSNAVKFTPRGGAVALDVASNAGGEVVITVADTGIGIAPEDLERVLTPFGRVEGAFGRARDGAGLGLPLAKRLVEAHGGSLYLESRLGAGTVVTLVIPRSRVPALDAVAT